MANPAYELAVRLGTVVHLLSNARRYPEGSPERQIADERGRPLPGLDLPEGRPVFWLHAVSMGEVGVAAVLVRELKKRMPEALAVVSTATVTGFESARKKIVDADAVVAARFDIRDLVAGMFDAIRPTAIILVEGDLWRNMLAIARRRGVPVFVANAKMSEKSMAFYRRFPIYTRSMLSRVARVYAQSTVYEQRFLELGLAAEKCEVTGNIKLDVDAPQPSETELAQIATRCGLASTWSSRAMTTAPGTSSPIITFGSIHPGEEIPAIRSMERIWSTHPDAHCLLVPRHIEKTPSFVESIRNELGIECQVYSRLEPHPTPLLGKEREPKSRVTVVDRMGMLMKLYALGDVGVVGGTFVHGVGGHNLTEPSFYGKPTVYGPYVYKQPGLHDLIVSYDAGRQSTAGSLPDVLSELVDDTGLAERIGENGRRMVEGSRGVAERIVRDILGRTAIQADR